MEFTSRIEEELKCPACRRLYTNPVTLPSCSHSVCLNCALRLQAPAGSTPATHTLHNPSSTAPGPMSTAVRLGLLAGATGGDDRGSIASSSSSSSSSSSYMSPSRPPHCGAGVAPGEDLGLGGSIVASPSEAGSDVGYPDCDGMSMVSETDSGVMVCGSRPDSCLSATASLGNLTLLSGNGGQPQLIISCPVCARTGPVDEGRGGAASLARTTALENIVEKYRDARHIDVDCQMCSADPSTAGTMPRPAVQVCEQCEVFYCAICLESYHPSSPSSSPSSSSVSRSPLSRHRLLPVSEGRSALIAKHQQTECNCADHSDETVSLYCTMCKQTVCCVCVQDGRHINHHVQPLGAMCKAQKAELSQMLHVLSEKARSGTEFIARLKSAQDHIESNCMDFETTLIAQCDSLIEAIKHRKQQLLAKLQLEKVHKYQTYKEQVALCTSRVHRTTGVLQFGVAALKEPTPSAFLQISDPLIKRVASMDAGFVKDVEFEPKASAEFQLKLDSQAVQRAILAMNLIEMKVPGAPSILSRECRAENNTLTIVWQPHPADTGSSSSGTATGGGCGVGGSGGGCVGSADGYVLELDDGNGGDFREVFSGKESICTVEGLHVDTQYVVRVKAYNNSGESKYSQCVTMRTGKVAWFTFDPSTSPTGVLFSNDNTTVTSSSFDDRVVLANVGFMKGVHYWEVTVDRYENNKDPAIGVARYDVAKNKILGKDEKGWSMYIDNARSWLMHAGQHVERTPGGIQTGSVVGVLLDLDRRTLSFYLDGEPHGAGVGFGDLYGVFYPAISINRNVQLTLHSGLDVPHVAVDRNVESTV